MAWNPSPEVAAARDFGKRFGATRVVIFYTLPDGRVGYASYGKTRALCTSAYHLAETTFSAFEAEALAEMQGGE